MFNILMLVKKFPDGDLNVEQSSPSQFEVQIHTPPSHVPPFSYGALTHTHTIYFFFFIFNKLEFTTTLNRQMDFE